MVAKKTIRPKSQSTKFQSTNYQTPRPKLSEHSAKTGWGAIYFVIINLLSCFLPPLPGLPQPPGRPQWRRLASLSWRSSKALEPFERQQNRTISNKGFFWPTITKVSIVDSRSKLTKCIKNLTLWHYHHVRGHSEEWPHCLA